MNHELPNIYCFISDLDKEYIKKLDNKITIIFRNYSEKLNIKKLKQLLDFCHSLGKKIILANNPRIALKLKFDGVYVPSFNKKIDYLLLKPKNNFKVLNVHSNNMKFNKVRMTVDESNDFVVIKRLVDKLGLNEKWENYTNLYLNDKTISNTNDSITRNEGYIKSIKNDLNK